MDTHNRIHNTPRVRREAVASPVTPQAHPHAGGGFDFSDYGFEQQPPPVIEVKQGCVLLPIFVAVWWYWTRRAARRAMSLLVPSETCQGESDLEPSSEEHSVNTSFDSEINGGPSDDHHVPIMESRRDKFSAWEDVVAQENSSPHLVKWITSRRREAKRRMRIVTKTVMNRSADSRKTSAHSDYENMEQLTDCDGILSVDDALSVSGCSHWECIDDTAIDTATIAPPKSLADDTSQSGGILA